ncbi:MAG: hypothetical protein KME15_25505 [Drouetiella hepatica Uher 2000/2452]|jgi:hypothetical protein|uniref:Uncharacterized protein n=1 Tax=Drouetiella hepatica Uher 2000/2452 TaxID=904376 RepID=A0A951UQ67_9CYAN|nr:hypothetical protein [Drouetiella hepatica Uher 2000/2452]
MDAYFINEYQVAGVDGETPQAISKPQILEPLCLLLSRNQCFFDAELEFAHRLLHR